MVIKTFIRNLDLSKASDTNFIPVVVLKNCGTELLCILDELFNIRLLILVFQIAGRSHQWSLCLKIVEKGLLPEATALLVFFS